MELITDNLPLSLAAVCAVGVVVVEVWAWVRRE